MNTSRSDSQPLVIHVDGVEPRPNLHAADGWVAVDIRFLTQALGIQNPGIALFRTVLPPGGTHMPHIHRHADEFVFITSGTAQLGDGDTVTVGRPGTLHYAPAGRVHWTGNRRNASAPVELIGGYVGAASLEAAGYEPIEAAIAAVRAVIEEGSA
jgi:quercetin dioxygenase-like cupin family protein